MSLEELWQLFPIILEELNPKYKNWYLIEAKLKKDLEKEYKNNLDGYIEAKTEFIQKWTFEARKKFKEKYLTEE